MTTITELAKAKQTTLDGSLWICKDCKLHFENETLVIDRKYEKVKIWN